MTDDEKNLFEKYWSTGSREALDTLCLHFQPVVEYQADALSRRINHRFQPQEFYSAGFLALRDAARRFDHTAGASFRTYASIRVWGGMVDQLREMQHFRRRGGNHYGSARSPYALEQLVATDDGALELMPCPLPVEDKQLEQVGSEENFEYVVSLLHSERNRALLRLRYREDLTMKETAWCLGLSESRVCQVENRILSHLKHRLGRMAA